ncbi:MAG: hypothetical protein Q9226_001290 [Calogaya cf. arnoldii]
MAEKDSNIERPNGASNEALREQGNRLYREGRVQQAIKSYSEAAVIAPSDPKPRSNLSAAHFELGDYRQCIQDISQALQRSSQDGSTLRRKLYPRLVKSCLHIKDIPAAEVSCAQMGDNPETAKLIAVCTTYRAASRQSAPAVSQLIHQIPRYLPALDTNPEYYAVGHDQACAQVNEAMMQRAIEEPISLFFGGIGDARNLYATLIEIARLETLDGRPPTRKYHATINDLKAPALARDLVVFYLLDDLSKISLSAKQQESEHLAAIFYLYAGSIIPPFAARMIHDTIKRVETALRSEQDLLLWLHIDKHSKEAILRSLKSWQRDVKSTFPVGMMVAMCTKHFKDTQAGFFRNLASVAEVHEPSLQIDRKTGWRNGKAHVCHHWEVNVTLIDEGWTENNRYEWVYGTIGFDPFEMMKEFYKFTKIPKPTDATSLYEYVAPLFRHAALALQQVRDRVTVEVTLGEVSGILDRMRHGLLDRNSSFPHSYDRIHLSNIPDYIGGPLNSILFALPCLSQNPAATVTANSLRNSPAFKDVDQFHCEYLAISDENMISKLMRTSVPELPAVAEHKAFVARYQCMLLENTEIIQKLDPAILRRAGLEHIRDMDPEEVRKTDIRSLSSIDLDDHGIPYPLTEYLHWIRTTQGPLSFDQLLSRPKLTAWLFTMFYKIVLPADRSSQEWGKLIYAPLNLTIFIKILIHLQELGYPAHWLSGALVQILDDQVTTSARPPESSPLNIAEAQRENPTKHLTTAPFMAEMATLTAMFLPTLPFAVITSKLPEVTQIHEYKITFTILTHPGDRIGLPVFVLIFWDDVLARGVLGVLLDGFPEIRQLLHPDGRLRIVNAPRTSLTALRWLPVVDREAAYYYTIDLDLELFSTDSSAHYRLDCIPRNRQWIKALLLDGKGNRFVHPQLAPEASLASLAVTTQQPTTEKSMSLEKREVIPKLPDPSNILARFQLKLFNICQKHELDNLPVDVLSWTSENLAFREIAFTILCLALGGTKLTIVDHRRTIGPWEQGQLDLRWAEYCVLIHGNDSDGERELLTSPGLGFHMQDQPIGTAPYVPKYWLKGNLVCLMPRLDQPNVALNAMAEAVEHPDEPTHSVAEDPDIQYPPNIVPDDVVETTFLRLVNLFDSAAVATLMSVRSSACSIPPEVISIILGQVTDAETFTACTKVSKTFRDLCQQRPLIMNDVAVTVPLDMSPGVDFRAHILSSGRQMDITFDANGCRDENIYRYLTRSEFNRKTLSVPFFIRGLGLPAPLKHAIRRPHRNPDVHHSTLILDESLWGKAALVAREDENGQLVPNEAQAVGKVNPSVVLTVGLEVRLFEWRQTEPDGDVSMDVHFDGTLTDTNAGKIYSILDSEDRKAIELVLRAAKQRLVDAPRSGQYVTAPVRQLLEGTRIQQSTQVGTDIP